MSINLSSSYADSGAHISFTVLLEGGVGVWSKSGESNNEHRLKKSPRGAVPRLGRWQESVLNPIPGRERPFVSYRVHCRCAFLMQALLLLLWLIYLILGSTPLGGRGHHGSFREQETNITTSSGWLAPGSFKAPCQPPPVALTSSPPPSRSRLLWFQAAVEPQKLYHQLHLTGYWIPLI